MTQDELEQVELLLAEDGRFLLVAPSNEGHWIASARRAPDQDAVERRSVLAIVEECRLGPRYHCLLNS